MNKQRTSRDKLVTVNGETHSLAEWAEKNGWSRDFVYQRIQHGWPPELAVSAPKGTSLKSVIGEWMKKNA